MNTELVLNVEFKSVSIPELDILDRYRIDAEGKNTRIAKTQRMFSDNKYRLTISIKSDQGQNIIKAVLDNWLECFNKMRLHIQKGTWTVTLDGVAMVWDDAAMSFRIRI